MKRQISPADLLLTFTEEQYTILLALLSGLGCARQETPAVSDKKK